ncbi:MAG: 4-(cytidine 5'-diphospho)-2-C-methyl-D-erythritol kinase [Clostridia bacterium]|nr:4-(cytidine 5'-diphospho)-2-C-methyl-D-erythritol kinase [Clostridia bacterium]
MKITLTAPAKINLTLALTGLREDGYHLLESVMQPLSLADTVSVSKIPSGITISCSKEGIPLNEKNLCYKAAKAYLDEAKIDGGVKIDLIKCIPDGAGMGGGSSDAAAVLKAMAALYPAKVDLFPIAAKIGADVPFFLMGKTCLCRGVGEELTPISFPLKKSLFCVVLKPKESLSTPEVYRRYDLGKPDFSSPLSDKEIEILNGSSPQAFFSLMKNDLELPAMTLLPAVLETKELLLSFGADAAMMTGSGSAVFALFLNEEKAKKCNEQLKKENKESYFCTLI